MTEKCEICGGSLGSFVYLGSFIYKCLKCKKNIVATSFDSIKVGLEGIYEIFITDENLIKKKSLGKGNIKKLLTQIENEASSGKLVYLKMAN